MNVNAWLRLGRVSNLPTVWTNVLSAAVLAGSGVLLEPTWLIGLLAALSVFYVAGMVLNDAFDADSDARLRPGRPVPSGQVARRSAFLGGFGMLTAAAVALTLMAWAAGGSTRLAGSAAAALALVIIIYDRHHKGNPWSPILMGMCRGMLFIAVAAVAREPNWRLVVTGAALQLFYVIGLTYAAKQEDLAVPGSWWPLLLLATPGVWVLYAHSWTSILIAACALFMAWLIAALRPLRRSVRRIGIAVGRLIAGICLVDALLLASMGEGILALVACVCLGLTLLFQRYVPGT